VTGTTTTAEPGYASADEFVDRATAVLADWETLKMEETNEA
jgi:hypothetical protein